jgi:hypothetical protein
MEAKMGWLFQRDPVDDPVAHLIRKFTYEDDTQTLQPIDGARAGNAVYLAVRSTDKKTGRSFVFAGVILISNTRKDGFGYKDQDEIMGPNECACPRRIMRLLSPLSDLPRIGYAAEWRVRVEAWHEDQRRRRQQRQLLRIGSVVTMPHAVRFAGGITASAFQLAHFRGRTPIFEALDRPGFYCRLRGATLAAAAVTFPADTAPPPD